MNTNNNRNRLLSMAKGNDVDAVALFGCMCLVCAIPIDELPANYDRSACTIVPTAPNAVQDVWAAAHEGVDAGGNHMFAAFPCDTDEDIQRALATRPCLVNIGGTMYAMNTDSRGDAAIILKDMRNRLQA